MRDNLILLLRFVLLALFQIVLFNHVQLWGLGCVFLYVYFVVKLPNRMNPILQMLLAAALGFTIDFFSHSFGLHTAATVLIAFLRPFLLNALFTPEERERYEPAARYVGGKFYILAAILVVAHHLLLFSLEAFSIHHLLPILIKTVISSALTMILVFCVESLQRGRR